MLFSLLKVHIPFTLSESYVVLKKLFFVFAYLLSFPESINPLCFIVVLKWEFDVFFELMLIKIFVFKV